MIRLMKWTVAGIAGAFVVGALCFGTDCFSYATSSFRMIRGKVKNAVPLDFELQRARDLLNDLVPELQAKIVLVAQEEVSVEELEKDIGRQRKNLRIARVRVRQMKDGLIEPVAYVGSRRSEAVVDLARRFGNLKLAEKLIEGKEKVLTARRNSLDATIQGLKDAQVRKVELEAEIERLDHEVRLVKLRSRTPAVTVDQSSLVKAERLVSELRKRLDLAQQILTCETLIDLPPEPQETEEELFSRIDTYFDGSAPSADQAPKS